MGLRKLFGRGEGAAGVDRQLAALGEKLKRLRAELAVLDEQLAHFDDDAAELATRALVSDDASVGSQARGAAEHAETHRRQRDRVRGQIILLEHRQDELLDRRLVE